MEDFVAALETPEQSVFIIAGEDAKTPLTEFKGKKFYLTITAGDGETFRQYQLVFAPNTEATVTTELATVDNEAAIIKDIAFGTELKTLKTSIVPAPQAIFEIYKADGKTLAKELVSGYKLIAIAGDTTTITEYEIQMAPNTEATLSLSMDKLWELFKTQSPANPKAEAKKEEAKPEVKEEMKEEMKEEAEEKKEAETEEAKEDMSEEEMSDESASEEAGMTITLE